MTTKVAERPIVPGSPFGIPDWISKAPYGSHLDVMKDGKIVQKLMIDERKFYIFGRVAKEVDITIEHASCSRFHAALIYHDKMDRYFLVDLGSTHGTFIGEGKSAVRLEPNTLTNIPIDTVFRFGVSTRRFLIRLKIDKKEKQKQAEAKKRSSFDSDSHVPIQCANDLPVNEDELESLTEYNTALNRRVAQIDVDIDSLKKATRPNRKRRNIVWDEHEHIINPEDIDPSIGKFRGLIETTIIPTKRAKIGQMSSIVVSGLPNDFFDQGQAPKPKKTVTIGEEESNESSLKSMAFGPISAQLGADLLMTAPDIDQLQQQIVAPSRVNKNQSRSIDEDDFETFDGRKHKKYEKEAWPGQHPKTK